MGQEGKSVEELNKLKKGKSGKEINELSKMMEETDTREM